jgi:hypothetical protein
MSTKISGKNAVDHEQHQFLLSSATTSAGPSTSGEKINGTISLSREEEDRTFRNGNCLDIEDTPRCFETNEIAEENANDRISSNGPSSPRQKECQDGETLVDELCLFHSSFNAEDDYRPA